MGCNWWTVTTKTQQNCYSVHEKMHPQPKSLKATPVKYCKEYIYIVVI